MLERGIELFGASDSNVVASKEKVFGTVAAL